jgi:hypothetical protein
MSERFGTRSTEPNMQCILAFLLRSRFEIGKSTLWNRRDGEIDDHLEQDKNPKLSDMVL